MSRCYHRTRFLDRSQECGRVDQETPSERSEAGEEIRGQHAAGPSPDGSQFHSCRSSKTEEPGDTGH
jgi:hypothetical protein